LLQNLPAFVATIRDLLRPAQGRIPIQLVETQFRLALVHNALAVWGHFGRHFAVSREEHCRNDVKMTVYFSLFSH
jgi:hypothetical protein